VFQTLTGTVKRRTPRPPHRLALGVSNPHRYGQKGSVSSVQAAVREALFQTLIGTVKRMGMFHLLTPWPGVSNPHRYGQKEVPAPSEPAGDATAFQTLIGTVKRTSSPGSPGPQTDCFKPS